MKEFSKFFENMKHFFSQDSSSSSILTDILSVIGVLFVNEQQNIDHAVDIFLGEETIAIGVENFKTNCNEERKINFFPPKLSTHEENKIIT